MRKLETEIKVLGTNIPGLTATLIKRKELVCMFRRSDGIYETGIIRIEPACVMPSGVEYPEREVYFNNEDFGVSAKTASNAKEAETHYKYFLKRVGLL